MWLLRTKLLPTYLPSASSVSRCSLPERRVPEWRPGVRAWALGRRDAFSLPAQRTPLRSLAGWSPRIACLVLGRCARRGPAAATATGQAPSRSSEPLCPFCPYSVPRDPFWAWGEGTHRDQPDVLCRGGHGTSRPKVGVLLKSDLPGPGSGPWPGAACGAVPRPDLERTAKKTPAA